jgi:hypothetical protein
MTVLVIAGFPCKATNWFLSEEQQMERIGTGDIQIEI